MTVKMRQANYEMFKETTHGCARQFSSLCGISKSRLVVDAMVLEWSSSLVRITISPRNGQFARKSPDA